MSPDRDAVPVDINDDLNPHRAEEQAHARSHASELLGRRGVRLFGNESDEDLANLWSAVERFESMVESRGGDTVIDTPSSTAPEDPSFVLPERRDREPAAAYVNRILAATSRLSHFER
jgi:hypothetical protein